MILESIAERVSANVKVVVRVRPPNNSEINGLHRNVIEIMNENVLVFDPNDEGSPSYFGRGKRHRDIQKRRRKDLKFAFDFVFSATASNEEVFKQTTQSVLEGLLCGYNCSGITFFTDLLTLQIILVCVFILFAFVPLLKLSIQLSVSLID